MILDLLRAKQWYKNLMIFLPIIFAQEFLNLHALLLTFVGFISLCFVSSSNYIINDVIDRKRDMLHSEKRSRPIASGRIGILLALLIALLLLIISLILALNLNILFFSLVTMVFLLTQAYSFFLKGEAFLDVIVIAVNFVLRAFAGAIVMIKGYMPWIRVSPWLILCPFFLSLFLSVMKREGDIKLLGRKAFQHKKSLVHYSAEIIDKLSIISTAMLIMSYALLTIMSPNQQLILTMPFALYIIFRYFHLAEASPEMVRQPEKSLGDMRLFFGLLAYFLVVFVLLYVF